MSNTNSALQMALDLQAKGHNQAKTLQMLLDNGYPANEADLFTHQAYKAHHLKKRKSGLVMGLMGCVLLVTGFFLAAFLFHADQSIDLALYGMTSVGIMLLLAGMTSLLGW